MWGTAFRIVNNAAVRGVITGKDDRDVTLPVAAGEKRRERVIPGSSVWLWSINPPRFRDRGGI